MTFARALMVFGTAALGAASLVVGTPRPQPEPIAPPVAAAQSPARAGRAPRLAFEPNRGQTSASMDAVARGPAYTISLASSQALLRLGTGDDRAVVGVRVVGGDDSAQPQFEAPTGGKSSYFIGKDPDGWVRGVPHHARVRYPNVLDGIDLVYYGRDGSLEYDFVVAPGADPDAVRLAFDGVERVEARDDGDLVLHLPGGRSIVQRAPLVYQEVDGERLEIPSAYRVDDDGSVAIEIGVFDDAVALVIDPVIDYLTFLGGNDAEGSGFLAADLEMVRFHGGLGGVVADSTGATYVGGMTWSPDFPATGDLSAAVPKGPGQGDPTAGFVTKYAPDGQSVVFSVFLGGSLEDGIAGIALDASNDIYVTGFTRSFDFPIQNGFQFIHGDDFEGAPASSEDAFVAKIDADGESLDYSSFLGGFLADAGFGITVDAAGSAYVVGGTESTGFPTTAGLMQTSVGSSAVADPFDARDAWAAKVSPDGSVLTWSTYLSGDGDEAANAVALLGQDEIVIGGWTESSTFPLDPQPNKTASGNGTVQAFVLTMDRDPTNLDSVEPVIFGGDSFDAVVDVGVDASGNIFACGNTASADFPMVAALDTVFSGTGTINHTPEAFVAKFDASLTTLFSTFLGGDGREMLGGLAVEGDGSVTVAGVTIGLGYPQVDPLPDTLDDSGFTPVVTTLAADGSALTFSSRIESGSLDSMAIAVDTSPRGTHLAGLVFAEPDAKPVNAIDDTLGGQSDMWVATLIDGNAPPPNTIRSFLLPKKISVKIGPGPAGKKSKPGVKLKAFFDSGPEDVDLSSPATLTLGPQEFVIPALQSIKSGKFFVFSGQGIDIKIKPSKIGTSKGSFTLKFDGDLGPMVDLNGAFTVNFSNEDGVDATGTVVLSEGKFTFGKKAGELIAPELSIRKAKAKVPGVGRHTFKFVAGFTTGGQSPQVAPDIRVAFGDIFSATLPSDAFKLVGKNFKLTREVDGVDAVTLTYLEERISVRGGDADILGIADGPTPLLLIFEQGEDVRAVFVRVVKKGKVMKY